jgi:hypothetical protein
MDGVVQLPTCSKESLHELWLQGEFRGIALNQAEWLRRNVPNEYRDAEEIAQQVAYYAMEAIDIYDTKYGMKFSSFLIQHLRLRCAAYQQYLWIRSSGNKRCRMISIRTPSTRSSGHDGRGKHARGPQIYDEGKATYREVSTNSAAESLCAMNELVEALSDEARDYLHQLFDYENQDVLVAAFKSKHFRSKVSSVTGMTPNQVAILAAEVKKKLPLHLDM